MTKIAVFGAGTWGIALARLLAVHGKDVTVWSAIPAELKALSTTHRHPNLPGMELPATMHYTADIAVACAGRDVLLFAVPSPFVRATAKKAAPHIPDGQLIVDVAKGVEDKTLMTMSEIIEDELAKAGRKARVVALSGPTHAEEVARDMPTAIVAAGADEDAAKTVQKIFNTPTFRVYTNDDRRGTELGGAVKNVIALAVGIALGLGYGDNAKAALITRGNAELARLGAAMGCKPETFAGLSNYVYGVFKMNFLSSLGYSLLITLTSVVLILLCCSMTGWYLTRVNNKLSKFMNLLIVFSMVVPFQMVMFTLSKTADTLKLNTPWNICIIYLGFGAGLAVFMFTGFMKSVPIEIEEAAMIDGCNPIQIFFKVVFPILKPTMISTAILETMWVWNDYLLPTLVLDIKKYRTIPMAIQYFRGGYGRVELAPMMACIIIAIIPIILLYITCQKYIIEGVVAGAVKG